MLVVVLALVAGLLVFMPAPTAVSNERPNILVIVTDDQRGQIPSMPQAVEWLQEGGTRFSRALATTPVCCPSRASLFTGRYAHNHGVKINPKFGELDHETTIQRYLQDDGYRTAIVGKFLNKWDLSQNPPHFDRWAIMTNGYYDVDFNIDGSQRVVSQYSTDFIAEHAIGVLEDFEATDETPWFMYMATWAPHGPRTPAPEYEDAPVGRWTGNPAVREDDKSDKPKYVQNAGAKLWEGRSIRRGQIRTLMSVDDLVGDVFSWLEANGELGQTLVFFLSDNGFMWAEHGLVGKAVPYRQSVRIPLLMRWPGRVAEGVVDSRLVANIDVAPTIVEAAGITAVSPPMDGWSLLGDHARKRILTEAWKGWPPAVGRWASLHTKKYSFTEYYADGGWKVKFREYYRHTDPWELVNRFGDGDPSNDPKRKHLHNKLRDARNCEGTEGPAACP